MNRKSISDMKLIGGKICQYYDKWVIKTKRQDNFEPTI
ncbi:hypothetical protein BGP_6397 [Beggiatoa sp. PS]|nr:hypothetical protein BGP_6397 [Beggiatoa sp. PS]